jgi:hypothetical protein
MSQFITVNNPVELPCRYYKGKPYAEKSIIFFSDIKEIYTKDGRVEVITKDGEGIVIENTFEDIINQLKGQ